MNDQLDSLLGKLKLLEDELLVEIHKKEKDFNYTAATSIFWIMATPNNTAGASKRSGVISRI